MLHVAEQTQQVAFRLSASLVERLDAYVEQLGEEQPGMSFTRADAVRVLLTRALDDVAKSARAPKPRTR